MFIHNTLNLGAAVAEKILNGANLVYTNGLNNVYVKAHFRCL